MSDAIFVTLLLGYGVIVTIAGYRLGEKQRNTAGWKPLIASVALGAAVVLVILTPTAFFISGFQLIITGIVCEVCFCAMFVRSAYA